jgi:hypothetical protein
MVCFRCVLRVSVVMLVAAALPCASSSAQSVVRSGADNVSVEAQSLPIGRVLRDMLGVAPIEALMIDPKVESHPVSAHIVGATAGDAINQILGDSNLPFLIWGGTNGPWRIFVGDKDAALRVTSGSPLPPGSPERAGGVSPGRSEAEERVLADERAEERVLADERAEMRERQDRLTAKARAQRLAESRPVVVMDDPEVPGGYTMLGESVIYNDPNFVPYKNRPEVVARRLATDVSQIP